jgi:hypothetical protein
MYKTELTKLQLGKESLTFNFFFSFSLSFAQLLFERCLINETIWPTEKRTGECQKKW